MASHLFIVAWNRSIGRMRPIAILIAAAFLGSVSALAPTAHAQPTPLYILDFDSPPHTVGLPPATGAGPAPRTTVSGVVFGTPTVVSSLGALADQPLKFDSRDWQYDQIALGLSDLPSSQVYCIESDVVIDDQGASGPAFGRFAIHHDTPRVVNIDFVNGTIRVSAGRIGTYALGQVIRVQSEVDLAADVWNVFLDGRLAYSGRFVIDAPRLDQVRFGTSLGAVAAIDNVHIAPNYCEPREPVSIDVKPGSLLNSINPKSRGRIPVAILSADGFDAPSEVDTSSLTFGGTGAEHSLAFCNSSPEDVNDDGFGDLVCHFDTGSAGFQSGDTEGTLNARTVSGTPLTGTDSVSIVPK
jgi:hypothetical protein